MCGITGFLFHDPAQPVRLDDVQRMCRTLIHRGPDDEGYFVEKNVGLGMRRLNVIDLAGGHQPISNEDGSIWIVFNGEIYNFRTLRQELENQGHKFSTNSDTETIVHAYEEYGMDCVNKLNGMFAFAIWDRLKSRLFLGRDRFGVKPLYYFFNTQFFAFGSELKALLQVRDIPRDLDLEAVENFLTFEYVPAPLSIFQSIKKLLPGHVLVIQNGVATIERYWDLDGQGVNEKGEHTEGRLYDLLKDAVRLRLISDVPLGAFLSGGIDSSAIVCLMTEIMERPVKTFSIGFDDPSYNELAYARTVAKHFETDHYDLVIQPDVVNWVESLVRYLDEPLADVSIFPTYLVSQLAREHVTVVLSGDGGDELFGGYDWYVANKVEGYYRSLPLTLRKNWFPSLAKMIPPSSAKKGIINKFKRFVEGASFDPALQHFRWNMFLDEKKRDRLFSPGLKASLRPMRSGARFIEHLNRFAKPDTLWRQQYADIKTFLVDDILVKVDRMSMAHSLEARTPFLDFRVGEFAARLPSSMKIKGFQTKYILKQCFSKKLPHEILHRRKQGFSIPMKNWLRKDLEPMMQDVLAPDRIKQGGLFNPDYIEQIKTDHLKGTANYSHDLWSLMMFEIWKSQYLS